MAVDPPPPRSARPLPPPVDQPSPRTRAWRRRGSRGRQGTRRRRALRSGMRRRRRGPTAPLPLPRPACSSWVLRLSAATLQPKSVASSSAAGLKLQGARCHSAALEPEVLCCPTTPSRRSEHSQPPLGPKACLVGGVRTEKNRRTQNSGVMTEGTHNGEYIDFYGCLKDIIQLQYNSDSAVEQYRRSPLCLKGKFSCNTTQFTIC